MFLGLPDLGPLVRGTDLDRIWLRILSFSHKSVERNEIKLAKKNLSQNFSKKFNF
jgi:hypothetical protein